MSGNKNETGTKVRRIAVLVFDGTKLLDVTGPAEVFAEANRFGANYEISIVSPDGSPVSTSIGVVFPVAGSAFSAGRFDTVLVSGGDVFPANEVRPELREATISLSKKTRRMASICTGAFVLADAGLLSGRSATTHWRHAHVLAARYPRIDVQPDLIYVKDRDVYTSAGVSAGIDLALALVEEDHGPQLARDVARSLVVYMQRPGGQSQFSYSLQGPIPRTSVLRGVVDWIREDVTRDYSVAALADHARISTRQLNRLFNDELDTTPAKYVEEIRFDEAKALLAAGHTVKDTSQRAGFKNRENLRRAFAHRLAMAPSEYQQRFVSTQQRISSGLPRED